MTVLDHDLNSAIDELGATHPSDSYKTHDLTRYALVLMAGEIAELSERVRKLEASAQPANPTKLPEAFNGADSGENQ